MGSRPPGMDRRSDLRPARIALVYALVSLLWIFGSGFVVAAVTSGTSSTALEIGKGTGFVAVTAFSLYVVLARRARSIRLAEAARMAADEERMQLAAAVEQAAEGIIITDPDARILYVNPALEHMSGYSKAELLGRRPSRLDGDTPSHGTNAVRWPSLSGSETWHGTLINIRKDGVVYEADTVIGPLRDGNGNVVSYVAVQHDVSQERAIERELAEARRMEVVGQLAGGIAHDFNNLLTAILGYAQLLGEEVGGNEAARADVDEILRASRSAAGLVRQLLALGRRQVLAPAGLALDDLVRQLQPMLKGLLGPGISFELNSSGPLEPVFADAGQLEQVLVNLTVNARDAMPAGGTFAVSISNLTIALEDDRDVVPPGRYVVLVASDTGTGMDGTTLARVFEPFFTTKSPGRGTGLGLATTYGIVKQSGGYLFADSEVGRGSTFTMYLPQHEGPVLARPAEATPEAPIGGTETIFVVEDDPAVRVLVAQALERLGYRVLVSPDSEQALASFVAETGPVPLLVTDIRLPGSDGPSLAAQMRLSRPGLRVLYVSGDAGAAMIKSGLLGADEAFLAKPFSADDLARRVRALLDAEGGR